MNVQYGMAAWFSSVVAIGAVVGQQFSERSLRQYWRDAPIDVRRIELADVDGDGDLDVFVGTLTQSRLYRNDGGAVLTEVTATALPAARAAIVDAQFLDADGDGDQDLVLANSGRRASLYRNVGGRFVDASAGLPATADGVASLAAGDFDGDGRTDLVMSTATLATRLMRNQGNGFVDVTLVSLPDPARGVSTLPHLADFDGDGDLDLALASLTGPRLLWNDGAGRFRDTTLAWPSNLGNFARLESGDFDGDGDRDLLFENGRLFINLGNGGFMFDRSGRLPSLAAASLTPVDFDSDGDLDLAFGGFGGRDVWINDGTGRFATTGQLPFADDGIGSVAAGDLNGDGRPDLLMASLLYNRRAEFHCDLLTNEGAGQWTNLNPRRLPASFDFASSVATGDFDADGDLDIVVGEETPYVLGNDGRGRFTRTQRLTQAQSSQPLDIDVVDLDADGDLDIASSTGVYLNDSQGGFQPVLPPLQLNTHNAFGDLDADGDVDIVTVGQFGIWVSILRNDGAGGFAPTVWTTIPTRGRGSQLADADGDGDLDWFGIGPDLWLNDGSGGFTNVTTTRFPRRDPANFDLAIGDVDGDGDRDLFVARFGQDQLWVNDGTGRFVNVTGGRLPTFVANSEVAKFADLDLDGDVDLVVAPRDGPKILLENDGAGRFRDISSRFAVTANNGRALAVGDFDGDRDLDILAIEVGANRLAMNLHRQLVAPLEPTLGQPYTLDLFSKPGYGVNLAPAIVWVAANELPVPLRLPGIGTLFLDPATLVSLPVVAIPAPVGMASVTVTVPSAAALIGSRVFIQAGIVDLATGALSLTNAESGTVRR